MTWELALRAVIKALVLPPGLFVVLLLLAVLAWRSFLGRFLAVFTAALVYLASTGFGAGWLARGLETYAPLDPDRMPDDVAALVVLMAGRQTAAREYGDADALSRLSMDRLAYAVDLHRRTGLPLILSGGRAGAEGPPLAELGREALERLFGLKPLAVEPESATTWENARRLGELLDGLDLDRVAVVTHAWHMPRAMFSLEKAGVDAVAAPTYYISGTGRELEWRDWLPGASHLADTTYLLHEYLGNWWYREFGG